MAESLNQSSWVEESFQRLAQIGSLMDDIASQAGALSTGVPRAAAPAAQVSGFLAVTGDVRQLALRCAQSAEEIRRLIGDEAGAAAQPPAHAQQVRGALDAVMDGLRGVMGRLDAVSALSLQYASGDAGAACKSD